MLLCLKNKTILLFFTKNKTFLRDIIPYGYVDIHSHLLPKIDDGSKSIEDTIDLIIQLKEFGFHEFITTPHVMHQVWENSKAIIEDNYHNTTAALRLNSIDNSFKVAAEYMLDDNFRKLFQNEKLFTLKDNFVLIEMSYINPPLQLFDLIFDLQVAGYQPILAHPERYNFYHNSLEEYKKLKRAGCLFQLNLLSCVGYYGANVSKTSDYLLKNNFIDYVGSDVHHAKHVAFFNKKIVLKNLDSLKEVIQNNLSFKS